MKLSTSMFREVQRLRLSTHAKPIGLTAASFGLALVYPPLVLLLATLHTIVVSRGKSTLEIAILGQLMFKTA